MKRNVQGAISPIDGRYHQRTKVLANYFSEEALIGYRTVAMIKYLLRLEWYAHEHGILNIPQLTDEQLKLLTGFMEEIAFTAEHAVLVKLKEKKTNHDVKAVEYVIRDFLKDHQFPDAFIAHCHFGLTSEDVTNIAIAHGIHDALNETIIEMLEDVVNSIHDLAHRYMDTPMLSRTHGQPATPTTFGKEMMIFVKRLNRQLEQLQNYRIWVKISGPSGNYNGHYAAYPEIDWPQFVYEFLDAEYRDSRTGKPMFEMNCWTNQIEDHDTYSELFSIFERINVIFIKFCTDLWMYISYELVLQKPVEGEVGSSAMPHKVNPIDFENAEGNLHIANALFEVFSRKLPHSRMQRDLSDSTIERNFGTAVAHCLIAYLSIEKGLGKIRPDTQRMEDELNAHPEILAEAYQLVLKKYGVESAYEQLKELTRGKPMTLEVMHEFLDSTPIPQEEKDALKRLKPSTYLGISTRLASGYSPIDVNYRLKDL